MRSNNSCFLFQALGCVLCHGRRSIDRVLGIVTTQLAVLAIPLPSISLFPHVLSGSFARSESNERLSSLANHVDADLHLHNSCDNHNSNHPFKSNGEHSHAAALCSAMGHKFVIAGCDDGQVHIWRLDEDIAVTALRAVAAGEDHVHTHVHTTTCIFQR